MTVRLEDCLTGGRDASGCTVVYPDAEQLAELLLAERMRGRRGVGGATEHKTGSAAIKKS